EVRRTDRSDPDPRGPRATTPAPSLIPLTASSTGDSAAMLRTRIITAAICLGVGAFVPAARSAPIVNPTVYSSLAGFQDQLQAGFYSEDFAALGAGNQGASLVFTGPAPSNGYSLTASVDSGQ